MSLKLNKAIFLDRDGVINREVQFVAKPSDFHILQNSLKALQELSKTDYKLIIVTNQSGMGYGFYNEQDYEKVNKKMLKIFRDNKIRIDQIYHCPHRYEEKCNCRKPNTGLLDRAKEDFNLDYKQCWLIGDKTSDIKAGENIGCKTILVKTGAGGKDGRYKVKPDYVVDDLMGVVKKIK